jgi:hypothetical protein
MRKGRKYKREQQEEYQKNLNLKGKLKLKRENKCKRDKRVQGEQIFAYSGKISSRRIYGFRTEM